MAENNTTSTPGFWSGLGQSILSKGLDLADSFAAIAVAKEQSKAATKAAEAAAKAAVASNAAPNNVATKANSQPGLSTGAWIGIGAGVLAVFGLLAFALFGGRNHK